MSTRVQALRASGGSPAAPLHPIAPLIRALAAIIFAGILALSLIACTRSRTPASSSLNTPTRVVALSPAIASIMRDIGEGGLIVGRHASDDWTDASIPACGDQVAGIDYEQLLRARPTHVFLQMAEVPTKLAELGRDRGFVVKNYSILSLDEIRSTTRELWNWGGAPGAPGAGDQQKAPIEARMDKAWSRDPNINAQRVGRVLLLAQVDPAGALGPGSWHDDILRRLGATPAIEKGNAFVTMSAEDVLRCAPDAIILISPRPPAAPAPASPPTPAELVARLGILGQLHIPAVQNARIALIDDPMCHLPSTAMIRIAEEMAEILERWSE